MATSLQKSMKQPWIFLDLQNLTNDFIHLQITEIVILCLLWKQKQKYYSSGNDLCITKDLGKPTKLGNVKWKMRAVKLSTAAVNQLHLAVILLSSEDCFHTVLKYIP